MQKKKYILWISLVFNLAFLLALVFNQVKPGKHSVGRSHKKGRINKEWAGMSADVKAQLRDIWKDFPTVIRPVRARLDSHRVVLSEILLRDKPDSMQISIQLDSIGFLQTSLEKAIVGQMLKEKEILPEKYQKRFLRGMMRNIINSRRYRSAGHSRHHNPPGKTKK